MSAIKIEGPELEAHAKNCSDATDALSEQRAHERGFASKRGGRSPTSELRELLGNTLRMLTRFMPSGDCWLRSDVITIVREICESRIELEWNGNEAHPTDPKHLAFWVTQSEDGALLLVRAREASIHLITSEVMLGFLIQVATTIAFQRALMHTYGLSRLEMQALVMRNQRVGALLEQLLEALITHNIDAWWDEHEDALRRFGHPLKQAGTPMLCLTRRIACIDLPLYCPMGVHGGERIDLFAVVGTCPSNKAFRRLVSTLRELGGPAASAPLYDLTAPTLVSLPPPPPTPSAPAPFPPP